MTRILLADDHDDIRHALATRLTHAGFEVIEARDGHEALALARERRPDLVILDHLMPGIEGIEVCWRIRQDPRIGGTPVIVITASPDLIARDLRSAADRILVKPTDLAELLAACRMLLPPAERAA